MRFRDKGFTLIELMVSIAVLVVLIAVAIPSFVGIMARSNADAEISELSRALNYARIEAINRGVPVQVVPVVNNLWTGTLNVQVGQVANVASVLRVMPAMKDGAVVNVTSVNGPANNIEFNNLGALNFPTAAVVVGYTRGTQVRRLNVGLNGRVFQ